MERIETYSSGLHSGGRSNETGYESSVEGIVDSSEQETKLEGRIWWTFFDIKTEGGSERIKFPSEINIRAIHGKKVRYTLHEMEYRVDLDCMQGRRSEQNHYLRILGDGLEDFVCHGFVTVEIPWK